MIRGLAIILAVMSTLPVLAAAEPTALRALNWIDYIDAEVLDLFEAETGIPVALDTYIEGPITETRLLAGNDDLDIAVVSQEYVGRLIAYGALQTLDLAALDNLGNLDPAIFGKLRAVEGNQRYLVPYLWGTVGIGYDPVEVARRLPDMSAATWSMVFDPEVLTRIADCGIIVIDSPEEVLSAALAWLGRDPNSRKPEDIEAGFAVLERAAPYWEAIDNERFYGLSSGEVCVTLSWSSDVLWTRDEAGKGAEIDYAIPVEGAPFWIDSFVIPANARNVEAAHRFIDFMLRPEIAARCTNATWAASANRLAAPFTSQEIAAHPGVYPDRETRRGLYMLTAKPPSVQAQILAGWRRIKLLDK